MVKSWSMPLGELPGRNHHEENGGVGVRKEPPLGWRPVDLIPEQLENVFGRHYKLLVETDLREQLSLPLYIQIPWENPLKPHDDSEALYLVNEWEVQVDDRIDVVWVSVLRPGAITSGHDHDYEESYRSAKGGVFVNDLWVPEGESYIVPAGVGHHARAPIEFPALTRIIARGAGNIPSAMRHHNRIRLGAR